MRELLPYIEALKHGEIKVEEFGEKIKALYEIKPLKEATIDYDRAERQGFPEVVYCEGKTDEQCVEILKALCATYPNVLGTRARKATFEMAKKVIPHLKYNELARLIYTHEDKAIVNGERTIAVICAGTSDLPVAEEAALTAEIMGNKVVRIVDVGVAGIHRLFHRLPEIEAANVVIVVAGMEGALASVIGGLVKAPLIAVPTSVGYGASFQGLAALLAMLNACAAGIGVVNIDNGFGAGRLAHIINSRR